MSVEHFALKGSGTRFAGNGVVADLEYSDMTGVKFGDELSVTDLVILLLGLFGGEEHVDHRDYNEDENKI